MESNRTVLITGAGGEIGHGLINRLSAEGFNVVTLDLKGVEGAQSQLCAECVTGDVLDRDLLAGLFQRYSFDGIFHLAAMLSSSGERNPERAFQVNVDGTVNLLSEARKLAERLGRNVRFIFPSTIAVYGLPDLATKMAVGKVREDQYLEPITMYGVNKLSCEHMGRYYSEHFGALADTPAEGRVDFRGLRFPGLISADTLPSGGTSDYVPEMLHAAAKGEPYQSFARPDTTIPFMTMPDAIECIVRLYNAPEPNLSIRTYNVGAFAPSAEEVSSLLKEIYPESQIGYAVDERRQKFLDTWPADVDDSAARRDWGHDPGHGLEAAFEEYLIPGLSGTHAE